jgi:predicted DNA repair protein MutK
MFLVGGSILEHGIPALHHAAEEAAAKGGAWRVPLGMLFDGIVGVVAGAVLVACYAAARRVRGKPALPA